MTTNFAISALLTLYHSFRRSTMRFPAAKNKRNDGLSFLLFAVRAERPVLPDYFALGKAFFHARMTLYFATCLSGWKVSVR